MSGRRGNNEGSIFQRKDGRWVGIVDVGYQNGKRARKTYYGKTRREVASKVSNAIRMREDGLPLANERRTVATYLSEWLASIESVVKPKTLLTYEGLVRLHMVPALGRRPLARLEPQHLQQLYSDKLREGLSPQSVRHIHAVLHRALEQAARWGLVARNIADLVSPPRAQRFSIRALTPDQARDLLQHVQGDRLEAVYVLALTTGMRQGEILALRWPDVDVEHGLIQVRGTLSRTKDGFQISEPKTHGSRRQVALGQLAIDALRSHRENQNAERLLRGAAWENNELVFANELGRPIDATNLRHRSFEPLLKRANLPAIRFHDLRHSAATLLLSEGTHPKLVSEMLGHSRVNITLDLYSHVTPSMHRQAADVLNAVLTSR